MKWLLFLVLTACVLHVNVMRPIEVQVLSETKPVYSYKKDVLPIIQNRCAMCHNDNMPGRNWLLYKDAYNMRYNIKLRLENRTMPLGVVMLEEERKLMIDWVIQGANK